MAVSTKIVHRRDTAANWTSTNPTLANGEIGFETDTLKFKVGNGSTAWTSLKYSQDASLLTGNASITTLSTTGDINTAGKLSVTASGGDEGGEIFLAKSVTNTSINTGVTIDVYQNKLRFFEQGGSARGYYIDITAGGAGVATALTGGGGGSGTVTSITASSPLTGGTITTSGTIGINASSTNTANYVVQRDASGNFAANQATLVSQKFGLDAGAPSFNSYTAGVRTILYDNIGAASAGYAIGINSGEFWHTTSDTTGSYKWYGGVTLAATLTGTGAFTAVANVSAPQLISTVSTGTAPFTVTSTTQVANLNVATSGTTSNVLGGAAGSLPYQSAANTTAFLARTATNNSTLAFNSSTNAPFWIQPTLSNTYYASTTSAQLAGLISNETGSGNLVFSISPVFTTPNIGAATATSITSQSSLAISTAAQTGSAGSITITGGLSDTAGTGGSINLAAGSYVSSGAPGNININAGGGPTAGTINLGTAAGTSQPIFVGNQGSVVTLSGDLVLGTTDNTSTGLSMVSGSAFEFPGSSTTSGNTTFTNVPGSTAFATSKPSIVISVLTANAATNTGRVGAEFRATSTTTTHLITFSSGTTARGSISTNSTTTTYSTSSDYRLKENIEPIAGATARLMLLKPSRFNFIEFPDRVVDGFIAHEAQEVVPESVTGEKDELNEDGSPAYQGIDQSKIVPLLTAALQESVEEIQELKSTITDLLSRIERLEN